MNPHTFRPSEHIIVGKETLRVLGWRATDASFTVRYGTDESDDVVVETDVPMDLLEGDDAAEAERRVVDHVAKAAENKTKKR